MAPHGISFLEESNASDVSELTASTLRQRCSSSSSSRSSHNIVTASSSTSTSTSTSTSSSSSSKSQTKNDNSNHTKSSPSSDSTQSNNNTPSNSVAPATLSSKVVFYPPSTQYWRIGKQWYDLKEFLQDHPGGADILTLARDRFEDCTFAFEAHHHNYEKARRVLQKYLLQDQQLAEQQALQRPARATATTTTTTTNSSDNTKCDLPLPPHFDAQLDAHLVPSLLNHDAFYSVLRRRVTRYLASTGCKNGEPTWECLILFWTVFVVWCTAMTLLYRTGSMYLTVPTGIVGAILGSFGHNWIHQPTYRARGFALLSLDTVGFSSEGWYRDHVLHHHMYTNTPWDHHYHGTDPFLITDPTVQRNWFQQHISPKFLHFFLAFGTHGNYVIHAVHLIQGQETWSIGKLFFILEHVIFYQRWGLYGLGLMFAMQAVLSNYYFTMALMNHNAEHCHDVKTRNKSRDWGEAQMISSADWSVHLSFRQSIIYLWLNFHTVHHCKCLCVRMFVFVFVGGDTYF